MITSRLEKIRTRLFEKDYHDPGVWYFKEESILNDENRNEPLVVRKGLASRHMGEHLPAYIREDELIVGNPNMNSVGFGTVLPIYATEEELANAAQYKMNENSVWGHHPPHWEKVLKIGFKGIIEEIQAALEKQYAAEQPDGTAIAE